MKGAVAYTALVVLNLIAYTVGVSVLPAEAPVHFAAGGAVDGFGSAWAFVAMPAAAALISLGVFAAIFSPRRAVRTYVPAVLAAVGWILVCLGWMFFGMFAQDLEMGETARFPWASVTTLPASFVLFCLAAAAARTKEGKAGVRRTVCALTAFAGGALSASSAIAVVWIDATPRLDWISAVVFGASAVVFVLLCVWAFLMRKRERSDPARMSP